MSRHRDTPTSGLYQVTPQQWVSIASGSRWRKTASTWGPEVGAEIRVLAVASGYAMVRRPHCMPFVLSLRELATQWELVP